MPEGNPDTENLNIAADLIVNPICQRRDTLRRTGWIPNAGWTVEATYDDIVKNRPDLPQKCRMGEPGQGQPQQGDGQQPPQSGQSQPGQKQDKPGQDQGQPGQPGQGQPGKGQKQDLWGTFMEPKNEDGTPLSEAGDELAEDIKVTWCRLRSF
jgi:hypothetical protein